MVVLNFNFSPVSNKITIWQKILLGKTLANRLFQSFGEEIVGEFTIANISCFSESGFWLDKTLANVVSFPNSPKFSPARILHYTILVKMPTRY